MNSANNFENIIFVGNFALPDVNAAAVRVQAVRETLSGFDAEFICTKEVKNYVRLIFEVIRRKRKNSIIWLYNPNVISVLLFNTIKTCSGTKVVIDITEKLDSRPVNVKKALKFLSGHLVKKMLTINDGLIVSSVYSSKIHFNKNTLVLPTYLPSALSIPPKEAKKEKVIIYFGSPFALQKSLLMKDRVYIKERLDLLVKGFDVADRNDWRLFLVGVNKTEFLDVFPDLDDIVRDNTNICFFGRLHRAEVLKMVASSSFSFCVRDDKDGMRIGFPTKVFESVAVGTRVIVNDTSDVMRYLTNYDNCFLVSERDFLTPNSIFQQLDKIVSHSDSEITVPSQCRPSFWRESLMAFLSRIRDKG
ncbi:glycosyltransferase [Idiomarina seosinensis]|uniref:glycosyltransferase n=1 Tax=Idiomarina seosinensis TaxID=281739 RepID=UPI00384F2842